MPTCSARRASGLRYILSHLVFCHCSSIRFSFYSFVINGSIFFFLQAIYVYQKASILSMLPEEEVTKLGENVVELFRYEAGSTVSYLCNFVKNNDSIFGLQGG